MQTLLVRSYSSRRLQMPLYPAKADIPTALCDGRDGHAELRSDFNTRPALEHKASGSLEAAGKVPVARSRDTLRCTCTLCLDVHWIWLVQADHIVLPACRPCTARAHLVIGGMW